MVVTFASHCHRHRRRHHRCHRCHHQRRIAAVTVGVIVVAVAALFPRRVISPPPPLFHRHILPLLIVECLPIQSYCPSTLMSSFPTHCDHPGVGIQREPPTMIAPPSSSSLGHIVPSSSSSSATASPTHASLSKIESDGPE